MKPIYRLLIALGVVQCSLIGISSSTTAYVIGGDGQLSHLYHQEVASDNYQPTEVEVSTSHVLPREVARREEQATEVPDSSNYFSNERIYSFLRNKDKPFYIVLQSPVPYIIAINHKKPSLTPTVIYPNYHNSTIPSSGNIVLPLTYRHIFKSSFMTKLLDYVADLRGRLNNGQIEDNFSNQEAIEDLRRDVSTQDQTTHELEHSAKNELEELNYPALERYQEKHLVPKTTEDLVPDASDIYSTIIQRYNKLLENPAKLAKYRKFVKKFVTQYRNKLAEKKSNETNSASQYLKTNITEDISPLLNDTVLANNKLYNIKDSTNMSKQNNVFFENRTTNEDGIAMNGGIVLGQSGVVNKIAIKGGIDYPQKTSNISETASTLVTINNNSVVNNKSTTRKAAPYKHTASNDRTSINNSNENNISNPESMNSNQKYNRNINSSSTYKKINKNVLSKNKTDNFRNYINGNKSVSELSKELYPNGEQFSPATNDTPARHNIYKTNNLGKSNNSSQSNDPNMRKIDASIDNTLKSNFNVNILNSTESTSPQNLTETVKVAQHEGNLSKENFSADGAITNVENSSRNNMENDLNKLEIVDKSIYQNYSSMGTNFLNVTHRKYKKDTVSTKSSYKIQDTNDTNDEIISSLPNNEISTKYIFSKPFLDHELTSNQQTHKIVHNLKSPMALQNKSTADGRLLQHSAARGKPRVDRNFGNLNATSVIDSHKKTMNPLQYRKAIMRHFLSSNHSNESDFLHKLLLSPLYTNPRGNSNYTRDGSSNSSSNITITTKSFNNSVKGTENLKTSENPGELQKVDVTQLQPIRKESNSTSTAFSRTEYNSVPLWNISNGVLFSEIPALPEDAKLLSQTSENDLILDTRSLSRASKNTLLPPNDVDSNIKTSKEPSTNTFSRNENEKYPSRNKAFELQSDNDDNPSIHPFVIDDSPLSDGILSAPSYSLNDPVITRSSETEAKEDVFSRVSSQTNSANSFSFPDRFSSYDKYLGRNSGNHSSQINDSLDSNIYQSGIDDNSLSSYLDSRPLDKSDKNIIHATTNSSYLNSPESFENISTNIFSHNTKYLDTQSINEKTSYNSPYNKSTVSNFDNITLNDPTAENMIFQRVSTNNSLLDTKSSEELSLESNSGNDRSSLLNTAATEPLEISSKDNTSKSNSDSKQNIQLNSALIESKPGNELPSIKSHSNTGSLTDTTKDYFSLNMSSPERNTSESDSENEYLTDIKLLNHNILQENNLENDTSSTNPQGTENLRTDTEDDLHLSKSVLQSNNVASVPKKEYLSDNLPLNPISLESKPKNNSPSSYNAKDSESSEIVSEDDLPLSRLQSERKIAGVPDNDYLSATKTWSSILLEGNHENNSTSSNNSVNIETLEMASEDDLPLTKFTSEKNMLTSAPANDYLPDMPLNAISPDGNVENYLINPSNPVDTETLKIKSKDGLPLSNSISERNTSTSNPENGSDTQPLDSTTVEENSENDSALKTVIARVDYIPFGKSTPEMNVLSSRYPENNYLPNIQPLGSIPLQSNPDKYSPSSYNPLATETLRMDLDDNLSVRKSILERKKSTSDSENGYLLDIQPLNPISLEGNPEIDSPFSYSPLDTETLGIISADNLLSSKSISERNKSTSDSENGYLSDTQPLNPISQEGDPEIDSPSLYIPLDTETLGIISADNLLSSKSISERNKSTSDPENGYLSNTQPLNPISQEGDPEIDSPSSYSPLDTETLGIITADNLPSKKLVSERSMPASEPGSDYLSNTQPLNAILLEGNTKDNSITTNNPSDTETVVVTPSDDDLPVSNPKSERNMSRSDPRIYLSHIQPLTSIMAEINPEHNLNSLSYSSELRSVNINPPLSSHTNKLFSNNSSKNNSENDFSATYYRSSDDLSEDKSSLIGNMSPSFTQPNKLATETISNPYSALDISSGEHIPSPPEKEPQNSSSDTESLKSSSPAHSSNKKKNTPKPDSHSGDVEYFEEKNKVVNQSTTDSSSESVTPVSNTTRKLSSVIGDLRHGSQRPSSVTSFEDIFRNIISNNVDLFNTTHTSNFTSGISNSLSSDVNNLAMKTLNSTAKNDLSAETSTSKTHNISNYTSHEASLTNKDALDNDFESEFSLDIPEVPIPFPDISNEDYFYSDISDLPPGVVMSLRNGSRKMRRTKAGVPLGLLVQTWNKALHGIIDSVL